MTDTSWQNRVTLLVNSCDAYADLWQPFFTLLKRYFCAAACGNPAEHRDKGLRL